MKVVELIIDGFKSYAVRTVISGWDESFNSITGLNGSGKSNILDSICFVLGITNMSTVRAQNLQELIYKRGQGGVTKASVTIVFDNRDTAKSPVGFEDCAQISVTRQIVLGGTSKYLINGHRAQQHTVQNLFQSVQLNINNPNFLIMQGRITKVLNMKPAEILAMIEEAAGTRMFEDRRDKAFKTMAKKEMKVQELNELLKEEIDPKLEKLRQEKRAFLDFQQTQNDLERTTKLVVAHDYVKYSERLSQVADDIKQKADRAASLEASGIKLKNEINLLQEDISKVRLDRDKELRKGGRFQAFEDEAKEHSHEMVRLSTVIDLKISNSSEDTAKRQALVENIELLEEQLKLKMEAYEKVQHEYDIANTELSKQSDDVNLKEELLQSLQTGVASREGQQSGYQGQLQQARTKLTEAATEQEQARLKISHLEKQVKEDEPAARKAKDQNAKLYKDLESLKAEASKFESELQKLGVDPERESEQRQQELALQESIRSLEVESEQIKKKVSSIDFNYSDPSPRFDRTRVKGLVAQLFSLGNSQTHAGTALEICAGGRLYNVVVDTAETGTQILQNGQLKKRVTIIPLNKIAAFKASAQQIGAAKKLAPGKVNLALSLIGYDEEVNTAMEYVFGSTLICDDAATAKKVTFDQAVRLKSVTLEGDVYDPAGTLSGGSAPQSSGVLVTLQKLNEISKELGSQVKQLAALQAELARNQKRIDCARKLKQNFDLKNHELALAEEQIKNNSASTIISKIAQMKEEIGRTRESISGAKARHDEAANEVKRIEKDMSEFNSNKSSKLTELQASLTKLKKSLITQQAAIKPLQQDLREKKVDAEQCSADLISAKDSLEEIDNSLDTQKQELKGLTASHDRIKRAHDIAQAQLDEERAKLSGFEEEMKALAEVSSSKSSQVQEEALEMQKLGHTLEKLQKDKQAALQAIGQMEMEHEWISDEKINFGKQGTPYDFKRSNMAEHKSSLKTLTERFQGMKRKINPKVMNMIDSVEKKEVSLKNMMKIVIRDKKKIEETINNLDEYKQEALHKTWSKVSSDFGSIFNELLPGSFARLDPLEGKNISDGLEVKVCLGKVWKQSLTELSGGQRSLIALSLIMALLQFKPAPMYILDEVDAALDLSHTQNIGRLIKTRFKGSQFIVVSLKDGMFQNANRIFRTRFSEGTSVVQALTPADLK